MNVKIFTKHARLFIYSCKVIQEIFFSSLKYITISNDAYQDQEWSKIFPSDNRQYYLPLIGKDNYWLISRYYFERIKDNKKIKSSKS